MEEENFSVLNKTRSNPAVDGLLFRDIKDHVLGKKYDLSLVWIGSSRSRKMNRELRGKDKPANILSFPLSKESGEIFIDLHRSKQEAHLFDETHEQFIVHLYIHGLYHLKGMDHGNEMEKSEAKTRKKFRV
ncbi:MAG: rRNA maturation RNase YbeY [Candidatus Paceibacterota bacterium]|jgi:probable rRNA maturation factor|nr:rRNA maturation RNase YbeY [Candidatus Paceibacterota bacterium]